MNRLKRLHHKLLRSQFGKEKDCRVKLDLKIRIASEKAGGNNQ